MSRDGEARVDRRIGPRRHGVGRRISGDRRWMRPAGPVGVERRAGDRRGHARRRVSADRRAVPAPASPAHPARDP
jgi:hypothetical protein